MKNPVWKCRSSNPSTVVVHTFFVGFLRWCADWPSCSSCRVLIILGSASTSSSPSSFSSCSTPRGQRQDREKLPSTRGDGSISSPSFPPGPVHSVRWFSAFSREAFPCGLRRGAQRPEKSSRPFLSRGFSALLRFLKIFKQISTP
jgi:hypothetical protein